MREQVKWFSEQMEQTLQANDHKGGWEDCSYEYLISRLEEETEELRDLEGDPDVKVTQIISGCTDIADFAMMIANKARKALNAG